jgi:glycerol-3-phosphate dehydrogenase (NAD(P)+)
MAAARAIQTQLNSAQFRVYTGNDPVAVETAGFYKNVLAIAAGMLHGLGYGANTHSLLLTRGLAEMSRLTEHLGGLAVTLLGLAGVGDVIATCGSQLSRNFQAGLRIVRGEPLDSLRAGGEQVAEGIQASLALERWPAELRGKGDPLGIEWPELPIARQVYLVLHEGRDPREALGLLMNRPPRVEGQGLPA